MNTLDLNVKDGGWIHGYFVGVLDVSSKTNLVLLKNEKIRFMSMQENLSHMVVNEVRGISTL